MFFVDSNFNSDREVFRNYDENFDDSDDDNDGIDDGSIENVNTEVGGFRAIMHVVMSKGVNLCSCTLFFRTYTVLKI